MDGTILTEEFPVDHPYHRGVFWAWHQIYVNGNSIGDGWIMKNIKQQVSQAQTSDKNNTAKLELSVLWESSIFNNSKPFLNEQLNISETAYTCEFSDLGFFSKLFLKKYGVSPLEYCGEKVG